MANPVAVIQFPGVNCEYETVRVVESVGLAARVVRWNDDPQQIRNSPAIILPGGFSYQDRIRAGVVAAKDAVMDEVFDAASRGVPVMGICNGAQILVESGIVPGFRNDGIDLALAPNRMPDRSGYYCNWVRVKKGAAACLFTEFLKTDEPVPIPMAHAEGRFVTANEEHRRRLQGGEGVALVYAKADGAAAVDFPDNPNGSFQAIAGVTNPAGNVLAVMPHPERAAWMHQVPIKVGGSWAQARLRADRDSLYSPGPGLGFFESLRRYLSS